MLKLANMREHIIRQENNAKSYTHIINSNRVMKPMIQK